MALTRIQIVTEICDIVGKNLPATAPSGALLQNRVVNYLNWGQRRVAKHHSFFNLQSIQSAAATVASLKTYPLATGTSNLGLTNVARINTVKLMDSENSRKLDYWLYRKFDKWYPRPENYSTGRPKIYTRWGNSVLLFNIPDAVYTLEIRYGVFPTSLTTDGQYHDFGEDMDELIVTVGVMETYLALQQYTDAKIWYELFRGQLEDAVRAEDEMDWEPDAEPMGSPGYDSGTPWNDPYGGSGDALYGYTE
ncbi:hypothetical protein KKH13_04845 [Patescibacteria group bacterium]|nr:hypothetical protein [Patescibacteria group bacterium]